MWGIANTVWVGGARDDQNEVKEKRSPAENEDPKENGDGDSPFHTCALVGGPIHRESCNTLDMEACKQEHVDIKWGHKEKHGKEHGDEADNDCFALIVDNESDATKDTSYPDNPNESQSFLYRHNAVVAKCIENGNVPVNGYDQKVAYGGNQRDTDHWIKYIVHVLDEVVVDD